MNEYREEEFDNCFLCKHPALKHVLIGLLIFFGCFSAFYVVSDWHFKRMYDPVYQMRRFDRAMMKDERRLDKMVKKEFQRQNAAQFIHVEKTSDAYKIIIDLRPFDNNEKNVEVKAQGNTLFINAAGERNNNNREELIKYNQAFAFTEAIDTSEITKVREGNHYIITVPFKD